MPPPEAFKRDHTAPAASISLEPFPGWWVRPERGHPPALPSAPEAGFNPKTPCLAAGVPTRAGGDREEPALHCEQAAVLGFSLSLGGGKALSNLLKQEYHSPNAFWLTDINPKTSLNQAIKIKKKKKEGIKTKAGVLSVQGAHRGNCERGAAGGMLPLAHGTEVRQAAARRLPCGVGQHPNPKPKRQSQGSRSRRTLGLQREGMEQHGPPLKERGTLQPGGAGAGRDALWSRAPIAAFLPQNKHPQSWQQQQKAVQETHRKRHSLHANLNLLLIRNHSSAPIYFPFLV